MSEETKRLEDVWPEETFETPLLEAGEVGDHPMKAWMVELGRALEGAFGATEYLADAKRRVDWASFNTMISKSDHIANLFRKEMRTNEQNQVKAEVDYYKAMQRLRALFMAVQGRDAPDIKRSMQEEREYIIELQKMIRASMNYADENKEAVFRKKYPPGKKRSWEL